MSEDKKNNLDEELENLTETFQKEYDKAAAEAEKTGVIQELDEIREEEDAEPEENNAASEKKKSKKSKPKKTKAERIASFVYSVLLVILLVVTACVGFYASAFTDFDSYIYKMKCADGAADASTKIGYYNDALGYLEEATSGDEKVSAFYAKRIQRIHELITVATSETDGYSEAMNYMSENLTEEQIASPKTAEFKAFLNSVKVFTKIADDCIAVFDELGLDASDDAIKEYVAGFTSDEDMQTVAAKALVAVRDALNADADGDAETALNQYQTAMDALAEYSTSSRLLTEKIVICTAVVDGYSAARDYAEANLTVEEREEPITEEFKMFNGVAEILKNLSGSVYDTVSVKVGEAKENTFDFAEDVAACNAPNYVTEEISGLFSQTADGIAAFNAGKYTLAANALQTVALSFETYGCPSQALTEVAVVAVCSATGYADAIAYAEQKLNATAISSYNEEGVTELYKQYVSGASLLSTLDADCYDDVVTAVAGLTGAATANIDVSAIVSGLNLPNFLTAEAQALLTNIARGVIGENDGNKEEALTYYNTAYEAFNRINAQPVLVLEKIAVLTYETKDLHAAYVFVHEHEDVLPVDDSEDSYFDAYTALLKSVNTAFSTDKISAFVENAKTALSVDANASCADIVAESGIDTSVSSFYEAYYKPLAEAIKAENDKNLTLAVSKYQETVTLLEDDGIAIPMTLYASVIQTAFSACDLSTAVAVREKITDDMLADADEDFVALCDKLTECDTSMQTVYEVFYNAYTASYYGSVPSRDDMNAQFDALLTDDASVYLQAFTDYYRYIAEMYFYSEEDGSAERQRSYLESIRAKLPEMIFVYGLDLLNLDINEKKYDEAKALAEEMLAVNAYDDTVLSMMSKLSRINGDLNTALAYAEKGLKNEDESYECERQYIIICMLNGKFADAYDSVVALYEKGFSSMNECETVAVYDALYTDATAEQKTKLSEIMSNINNDLYGNYGYSFSENTQAVIDGTKTLQDVFMGDTYDLP